MMRSLYSAVSGLKTHQTKMDVIGNNIANVNTEAFKASSVRFSEIMYQTTAAASSGDPAQGIGGVNAKQVGLGVSTGSTSVSITSQGASETTGNPFDLKLTDSQTTNFFIVSDGTNTFFTRAGDFYVDGNGYLCMSSTGYTLMGWQVDQTADVPTIKKDVVAPLQVMSPANQVSAPEATTRAYAAGVLDKNDPNAATSSGYTMTVGIFDKLGYSYTVKFAVTQNEARTAAAGTTPASSTIIDGSYTVSLTDILDSAGKSIFDSTTATPPTGVTNASQGETRIQYKYNGSTATTYLDELFGGSGTPTVPTGVTGTASTHYGSELVFNKDSGVFTSISDKNSTTAGASNSQVVLHLSKLLTQGGTAAGKNSNFEDVTIDFNQLLNYNAGGVSTAQLNKGDAVEGSGVGKKLGALTGLSIDNSGCIYGSYDNGNTVLLGQVPVAQFANASGLEKIGNNCYQTTLNSGEFDGIGVEITADGSKIETGALEMSNVDLSAQFTDMIVTQRGFQANSRVITTSDTFLEELINLKR